jgi:hypothetical protein
MYTGSPKPKKKWGLIISLLVILLIAALVAAGYFLGFFDKFFNSEEATESPSESPETPMALSLDDPLVQQLYGYVGHDNLMWAGPSTYYQGMLVTRNEISDLQASRILFNHLDSAPSTPADTLPADVLRECLSDTFGSSPGDTDDALSNGLLQPQVMYTAETVAALNASIYGSSAPVNLVSDIGMGDGLFACPDGGVLAASYPGGGGWVEMNNSVLINAEKQGNEIFLYDRYFRVSDDSTTVLPGMGSMTIGPTGFDEENIWLGYPDDVQRIFDQYGDEIPTYKHTFQQADNGSYYWVSTDRVG